MIITIDGPAGSGKSTVAKMVADALFVEYFDTGAMYRAFTYFALKHNVDFDDDKALKKLLRMFSFDIVTEDIGRRYFVQDEDVTEKIRETIINKKVSHIAAKGFVRKSLVKIQRGFAKKRDALFEGRDMGSVVFPKAKYKFFLTADLNVRALRRYKEMEGKNLEKKISQEEIFEDLKKRDTYDSNRKISPLICPKKAIVIDTSKMSIEEVVTFILSKVKKKRQSSKLYHFFLFILRYLFKVFYKVEIHGVEHIVKGGAIIAANHTSFFDPIIVGLSCPDELHFLARSSLFKNRFFCRLIEALNTHPLNRGVLDKGTLKKVAGIIKRGNKILIFPEGTRSKDGKLSKLKDGIGYIANYVGCDIVPIYIHGSYDIWSKHKKFPRFRGKVICYFASSIRPICGVDHERERAKTVTDRVYKSLEALERHAAKMSRTSTGNPD